MNNDDLDSGATLRGFTPGQHMFNRYVLTRILGQGGMGVVWLARDETLGRDVALKFLPEAVALDARAVDDMKRETRRSLDLTHPNIVRIHDFVSDARHAAISMEYVDGESLSKKALEKPERAFDVAEIAPIVQTLCDVLTYAHDKAKIVHRDLKPANLMLTRSGDLKVADFGISATLSDTTTRASTNAASTSGTPVYMSPQQMLGTRAAPTDDVYSLGATIYELLTGKPPFYSGNIPMQVQGVVPPSMAERRKELGVEDAAPIPEAWEATVAACLAKEATQRPQSAAEVWERLNGIVAPQAVRTTASPEKKEKRQTPESASSVTFYKKTVGILVAVVGIVIALIIGLTAGRNSERVPERETASAPVTESAPETQSSTVAQGYGTRSGYSPNARMNYVVPGYNIEMIYIAPGSFMMGSSSSESGHDNDETQHRVTLTQGYWLGKYEVTQGQWEAVMGNNPSFFKDAGTNAPVEQVSWAEAQEFCIKLTEQEKAAGRLPDGYEYSLPTEAQWEYACRAGTNGAYGGNGDLSSMGWYTNNSGSTTHSVGQKQANGWGLYDMHGNVWEWCNDWYGTYPSGSMTDPTGPKGATRRLKRGGGWGNVALYCRSAFRHGDEPGNRFSYVGFRLALRSVQ